MVYFNKKDNEIVSPPKKRLLVITGAGASHDLIDPSKALVPVEHKFRPPLTKNIFKVPQRREISEESACIQEILSRHSRAEQVGAGFHVTFSDNTKPLEKYLFDLQES